MAKLKASMSISNVNDEQKQNSLVYFDVMIHNLAADGTIERALW